MNSTFNVGDLIYDADIYDGMNQHQEDLQFYQHWLPENKEARILELCCGSGRLTIPIANSGYKITGVDYTSSMLKQAKVNALEQGVNANFIEADIRYLALPEKYDFIFIPFNSIHHLYQNQDLLSALNVAKNHLKQGGLFLLDCFNPDIRFIVEGEKALTDVSQYTTRDGRDIVIKQIMHYESHTQVNRIQWHFFINGEFDSIQDLDMRLFFPQELDSYIKAAGFNIIHKFGDFEQQAFNQDSQKQIFVCQ